MKKNLKKYAKPFLKLIGIYSLIYYIFFSLIKIRTILINYYIKKFYKIAPVLLYHRIVTVSDDPIKLCVTPECFERHLKFIKEYYDILPLSELSKRLVTNTLKGNEISLTFDDGYKDNLTNALPLLEKYNIPATIFITTGQLGQKSSYKWDMIYSESDRSTFLNRSEIKLLASHPLIEIGAHTDNHPRLSDLSSKDQKEEIVKSKKILEGITGNKVNLFAYPFGGVLDFNHLSQNLVKEAGFIFAYSNTQVYATATKNCFCIPRINIRESTNIKKVV